MHLSKHGSDRRPPHKTRKLRLISTKVCETVREKGRTNYSEVAEALVADHFASMNVLPSTINYDVKNIRRRVYDALNVLTALNIIEKEKKEIRWRGMPVIPSQEYLRLEIEKNNRQEAIRQKTAQLQERAQQLVALRSLLQRNRDRERLHGRVAADKRISLPFIVLNTPKGTIVDCGIASDKTNVMFKFDNMFEIYNEMDLLRRMGLAFGLGAPKITSERRERIRNYLPISLRKHVDDIIKGELRADFLAPPKLAPLPLRSINLLRELRVEECES